MPLSVCLATLPNSKESLPRVCEMLKKAQLTADCITTLPRNTKDTRTNLCWLLLGWNHRAGCYEDEPFVQNWSPKLHQEAKTATKACTPALLGSKLHLSCLLPSLLFWAAALHAPGC